MANYCSRAVDRSEAHLNTLLTFLNVGVHQFEAERLLWVPLWEPWDSCSGHAHAHLQLPFTLITYSYRCRFPSAA